MRQDRCSHQGCRAIGMFTGVASVSEQPSGKTVSNLPSRLRTSAQRPAVASNILKTMYNSLSSSSPEQLLRSANLVEMKCNLSAASTFHSPESLQTSHFLNLPFPASTPRPEACQPAIPTPLLPHMADAIRQPELLLASPPLPLLGYKLSAYGVKTASLSCM